MQAGRGSADSHVTRYRADIEGLRAVAVLAVIAYHLSSNFLPGGYLGVDVFFVLSGYLITGILWREVQNGTYSISRFYERRIRRIMPVLLVVLLCISVAAVALLLPIDLIGYAKSLFATLTFIANVYFWRDTDYFSRIAAEKPLLHIWSLGVEEQFYIFFPLVVLLCARWRRSALVPILSLLVLLSLITNIVAVKSGASGPAFFLLPTRAWELGAGALLALMPARKIRASWQRHSLGLIAAALLAVGFCGWQPTLGGLIPVALPAVAGTVIAIWLGSVGGSWLNGVLSRSIPVWIGLISYSLYLWHWPVIVFSRYYLVHDLSLAETLIALLVMFTMAILSWRYIERPFRNRSMRMSHVLLWVGGGAAIALIFDVSIVACHGFPNRLNEQAAQINMDVGTNYRCGVSDYLVFGANRGCVMALPSRNPADATVVLLGNSHAQMYAPLIGSIVRENGQKGLLVPANGCLPMTEVNLDMACMHTAQTNLNAVEGLPNARVVILGFLWETDVPLMTASGPVSVGNVEEAFATGLDRLIDELEKHGKRVVLIGPLAVPGWDVASIVGRKMAFGHEIAEPLFTPQDSFMATYGRLIAHFSARPDLIFVRPDQVQCREGHCDYLHGGRSLFADWNHLSEAALPQFRPVFEPALKQAFAQASPPTSDIFPSQLQKR